MEHRNHHNTDHPSTASQQWYREMKSKLEQKPKLLVEKAGKSTCCIFRVPQGLVEINHNAYHPRIVSIGPYHHGSHELQMIQEHKWRFLRSLLDPTSADFWQKLQLCFKTVAAVETEIRECYSESTDRFGRDEFVEMMVVDGCFIIYLVYVSVKKRYDGEDPIFKMDWILPFIMRDLLKLENQIPFFVLEKLFEITIPEEQRRNDLAQLILNFFSFSLNGPGTVRTGQNNKHLLNLVRESFRPEQNSTTTETNTRNRHYPQIIQPSNKLNRAGIKFEPEMESSSFLDVKFSNGVLKIPPLRMDDFITCFILNCVAFEQCHGHGYGHCEKYVTDYATFMGCLINNPSDAGFLCDCKVIENYYGTDVEVTGFFDKVGKDVAFDLNKTYLWKVIRDVNVYYSSDWHVGWASFKHTYFDTPWSFMSAMAALLLLILTFVQALLAYLSYAKPS